MILKPKLNGWKAGAIFLCLLAALIFPSDARAFSLPPIWRWSNPLPHGANVYDMSCGNGIYVQVCERGQVFTSDDGQTWTPRDTGVTTALRGVCFFGGR